MSSPKYEFLVKQEYFNFRVKIKKTRKVGTFNKKTVEYDSWRSATIREVEQEIEKYLAKKASEGWTLVSVAQPESYMVYTLFFRRSVK